MSKAETPTIGPQLEVVKDAPATPKEPETEQQLMQRIAEIEAEITKCDDGKKVFEEQLSVLKKAFLEVKTSQGKEIDTLLDGVAISSSKKLLDQVLQLSTPAVAQLTENISKVGIAVQNIQRKRHALHLEKKELEKQVGDIDANRQAKVVGEAIDKVVSTYNVAEKALQDLKKDVALCSDIHFANRLKALGFSDAHVVIADSHLKQANLQHLSLPAFIDAAADVAQAYGGLEIKKDYDRQADIPLARKNFMPAYGGIGSV